MGYQTEYRLISPDVLAEFRDRGDQPEFWASRWRDTEYERYLARYERGYLAQFQSVFPRHLSKEGRILEAGCGRGQFVAALRRLGYDAIGVDFSEDLVAAVRRTRPDLPIFVGDVRRLDHADSSFGAYISLGVVEHFWDGPETILAEARRVLKPDGTLLISVPHFSPAFRRRALAKFNRNDHAAVQSAGDFYQFYFTRNEFVRRVEAAGFTPIEALYYDPLYGAKRAYPRFDRLYDSSYLLRAVLNRLFKLPIPQVFQARFAHMLLIIALATPIRGTCTNESGSGR